MTLETGKSQRPGKKNSKLKMNLSYTWLLIKFKILISRKILGLSEYFNFTYL